MYELQKLNEHADVFEAVRTKFTPRNTFSLDSFINYSNLRSWGPESSWLYIIGKDELPEWAEDIRGRITGQQPVITTVMRDHAGCVRYRGLYRVGKQPKDKKGRV